MVRGAESLACSTIFSRPVPTRNTNIGCSYVFVFNVFFLHELTVLTTVWETTKSLIINMVCKILSFLFGHGGVEVFYK